MEFSVSENLDWKKIIPISKNNVELGGHRRTMSISTRIIIEHSDWAYSAYGEQN
jgi:hypothetical protein